MMSFRWLPARGRGRRRLMAGVLVLALGTGLSAQTPAPPDPPASPQQPVPPPRPASPAPPPTPAPPPAPEVTDAERVPDRFRRYGQPVVRIGQDYRLRAGEAVGDIVVISGSANVEGRVDGDLVVVLGSATLGPNAAVAGDFVVVSGSVTIAPGATVAQDFVVVGGRTDAPADFSPGGEHVVVGDGLLGVDFSGVVPWVTRGLMWGRPLVPTLPWMWALVGIFLFIYLAISLLFSGAVQAGVATLTRRPFTAFLTGLLVLLLVGPISVILAVSIIGVPVVPFLLCALLVAGLLGKVSVMHWIGDRVAAPDPDSRLHWTRSFLIGFAVITVAYMIPVLGFSAWALLGVLGLGAASLAFVAAWRRENPDTPRRTIPPVPPPPPAPPAAPMPPATPVASAASAYATGEVRTSPIMAPDAAAYAAPEGPAAGVPPVPPAAPRHAAAGEVDLRAFPFARFLERAAAFALDLILVMIVYQLLGIRGPADEERFFLLLFGYHVGFWSWKGTTVGGIICQLRLVRTDGGRLQFVDALVRGFTSILSLVVLGLGALWILRDPERQAWHDKIAGTYVVKVPRHWPVG